MHEDLLDLLPVHGNGSRLRIAEVEFGILEEPVGGDVQAPVVLRQTCYGRLLVGLSETHKLFHFIFLRGLEFVLKEI